MSTPASIAKHPIHPMLVVLPMGLWVFSLVADLFSIAGGDVVWKYVTLYTIAGGVAGALIAAVPGLIDFFSLKEGQTRRLALYHMVVNLAATAIFAVNFYLRLSQRLNELLPIGLSVVALVLIGAGGWLGGELVYVRGLAVEPPPTQRRSAPELREIPGGRARRIV
jgi:uncharacterized membrane protein